VITGKLIDQNVNLTSLLCLPEGTSSSKTLLLVAVLAIVGALTACGDAHLPLLISIAVSPANSTIDIGQTQQFIAMGTFSDGSTKDLTNLVTWSSSNTNAATISASGLALGHAKGSSVISATFNTVDGPVTGAASLGVIVTLKSITITPVNPSIAKGTSLQLTAIGIFSDGTTQDLTGSVSWTSSSNGMVTVTSGGLVTGVAVGSAIITATEAGVSATTTVTVTPAVLISITITPPTSSIAKGTTQQLIATGNFSDGTTQDITKSVTWASSDTTLAGISNTAGSQGLVTGNDAGNTTITASLGGVTGTTPVTVTPAVLTAIVVSPVNPSIPVGTTVQLMATGVFSDGSTQDITTQVSWTSSSVANATVGSGGLVTGIAQGSATMTASLGGLSDTTNVTVTPAVLTSIAINPPTSTIPAGTGEQLTATGTYSDGTTKDLTQSVTWGSSDQSLAVISNATGSQGFVTGTKMGGVTIVAILPSAPGVTGSASVTLTEVTLVSIAVSPVNPSISDGATVQLKATGTYSDGSMKDLTNQVSWISSSDPIAHVDNTVSPGLVTGIAGGGAMMTATLGTVSGATTVTVLETCDMGDVRPAYNAIPFGGVNCSPPSWGFEADAVSEFGDGVVLATGTGRTLVQLNVLFSSYACSQSGVWYDGTCQTMQGDTFTWPITANIYDAAEVPPKTPIATVTQTQTIPYRPSADPVHCPGSNGGPAYKWFNPLNITSPGGCQSGISTLLTFTFTTQVTLPDQVVWTVAFNTTHYGAMPVGEGAACVSSPTGCPYDELNVGVKTFHGEPYAGADIDSNAVYQNSAAKDIYCDGGTGGTGFLRLDTPCWTGFRPLGQIITH